MSLVAAVSTGLATPAVAAPVGTVVDGVVYVADDAAPAAGARVTGYTPGPTAVVIPDSVNIGGTLYAVTEIADAAFMSSALTSLVIPDSVHTIGDDAFRGASSLTSVDLGDGVETIGEYAFAHTKVAAIDIPDSVTSIARWAFDSMDLRSLTIGTGLTEIGLQVFSNNNRLESVVIPPNVTSIAYAAFAADDLRTLVIGSGVTTIGDYAFAFNNSLASVVIPASVTTLGDNVFDNNATATSLTATFEGAAPASIGTNVFDAFNPVVVYRWRFGDSQVAGGFASPTWQGVASRAIATVAFDTGGLSTPPADQDVEVGTAATAPTAPTATGRTFAGWAVAPGGAGVFDFSTPVTGDLDLVAQWTSAPGTAPAATLPPTGRGTGEGVAIIVLLLLAGASLVVSASRRRPVA